MPVNSSLIRMLSAAKHAPVATAAVSYVGHAMLFLLRWKNKLLYLAPPTKVKVVQCLVGLFGFWIQHISHLGCLIPAHIPSDFENCYLCVGPGTGEGSLVSADCCVDCSTR